MPPETSVLPIIRSEADRRVVLGAVLSDGTLLRGQNTISHPGSSHPGSVDKSAAHEQLLPCPIRRVCYLSTDAPDAAAGSAASSVGAAHETYHEVYPQVNPLVTERLKRAQMIIYGAGSLYTSICPSLVVRGVGEEIAALPAGTPKILMLNGHPDRETSSAPPNAPPNMPFQHAAAEAGGGGTGGGGTGRGGSESSSSSSSSTGSGSGGSCSDNSSGSKQARMDACDYVRAVAHALNRRDASSAVEGSSLHHPACEYVNVLLYPSGAEQSIAVDEHALASMGVRAIAVPSTLDSEGRVVYAPQGVVDALARVLEEANWRHGGGAGAGLPE